VTNRRLKEQSESKFQAYEGYFSMHDTARDAIGSDRLGMRLYLFKKDDARSTITE
jgi:hypothetical protein